MRAGLRLSDLSPEQQEIERAKKRAYNRANPEKIKEKSRQYRLENREKVAESKRKYNLTPNGKANHHAACVRRRVRFAINSGIMSDKGIHWTTLAEKQGSMLCSICGRECVCSADRRGALYPTVDHIIPISKGGTHTWDNVRLVCRACNASKKDKIPSQMGQGG